MELCSSTQETSIDPRTSNTLLPHLLSKGVHIWLSYVEGEEKAVEANAKGDLQGDYKIQTCRPVQWTSLQLVVRKKYVPRVSSCW